MKGATGPSGATGPTGPTGPSRIGESYHVDLTGSTSATFIDVPLKNVIYRLYKTSSGIVRITLRPQALPVEIDYKRHTQYDATAEEGELQDSYTLNGPLAIDNDMFTASREVQRVWLRQKDPTTELYSTCLIYYWSGGPNGQRTDIWVEWIHQDVSYEPPQP